MKMSKFKLAFIVLCVATIVWGTIFYNTRLEYHKYIEDWRESELSQWLARARAVSSVIRVPQDYPTIGEAIDAADAGDTILVSSGEYYEWGLRVNKTLSLVGENASTTIIDGGGADAEILIIDADNVNLNGFTIQNCSKAGIYLRNSTGCTISGNIEMKCDCGIALYHSSRNNIVNNIVSNNSNIGISLSCSNYNALEDNVIAFSYMWGMLFGDSSYNIVTGNTIKNNLSPFLTGAGFKLDGHSNDNIIYHNNFIHNRPVNAWNNGRNVWDNGCEGNYWWEYNGTDADGDGIGDTPYICHVQDDYPLMNPYWNLADVNHDLNVDLYDATIVCVAYGSKLEDERYNCHCDLTEPYGTVNLYDAVIIFVNYGKEFENP